MREYLSIFVLACLLLPAIALIKEKRFILPLLFLIIPMVLFVFFVPQRYVPDVDSVIDTIEKQVQTPVTTEIQVQTPVTTEIQVQTPVTTEKQVQTPVNSEIQVQTLRLKSLKPRRTPVTTEKQIQTSVTTKKQVQSIYLNAITNKLSLMRQGFRDSNYDAGSRIDANHSYASFSELVKYFPRALQIGLLSPFPPHWFEKGQSTGKIGRLLSGMEMIIWYPILYGFIFIAFKHPSELKPFATVFLFSITVMTLLAYVVPNFGTIFRMRQAYMIPFFLFGAYGLSLMRCNFLKKRNLDYQKKPANI